MKKIFDSIASFLKKYNYLVVAGFFLLAFIIFTILVKTVDVNFNVYSETYLGFYNANYKFNDFVLEFGKYEAMKKASDVLMYLSFGYVAVIFVFALIQLIKGKSFKKIDKRFYVLLGACVAVVVLYFVFEIVKVNYSPDSYVEKIHENPEDITSPIIERILHLHASYPSTHVFVGSTFYLISTYTAMKLLKPEKEWISPLVYMATGIICLLMVFTRALSAKHWLTDIIASILLIISVYTAFIYVSHKLVPEEANEAIESQKE